MNPKAEVYRHLAAKFGFTPNQIADMTYSQQYMLMGIDNNVITFSDYRQYQAWVQDRKK